MHFLKKESTIRNLHYYITQHLISVEQHSFPQQPQKAWIDYLWDAWCLISVVGIWPRFIEPHLLFSTKISVHTPSIPSTFSDLRIAFFSDLHWNAYLSCGLLQRLVKKIQKHQPHLILFGGDALSYGQLFAKEQLKEFLSSLHAPLGVYAVLGNHDYACYTTESSNGTPLQYDKKPSSILWGLKKLWSQAPDHGLLRTKPVVMHEELLALYNECGIQVLHNQCVQIGVENQRINLVGLGDLTAGHCDPLQAFQHWDQRLPGVVLVHNPNAFPLLLSQPGDLLLSGHTHGGQVNLPFFSSRLVYLSSPLFKSGFHSLSLFKKAYITRGIGSCYPFRWFTPPEITFCTLTASPYSFSKIKSFFKQKKRTQEAMQWAASRISTSSPSNES